MSEYDFYDIFRDLPRRREVWLSIANLYGNSEYLDAAVGVFRESGYSWAELDHIARYEVAPAICFKFARNRDGGAAAPDPDWLAARIVKTVGRNHHFALFKLFGRFMMRPLESDWREVERRLKGGEGPRPGPAADPPAPG